MEELDEFWLKACKEDCYEACKKKQSFNGPTNIVGDWKEGEMRDRWALGETCCVSCFAFYNKPIDTFVTNNEVLPLMKEPFTYAAVLAPVWNKLSC